MSGTHLVIVGSLAFPLLIQAQGPVEAAVRLHESYIGQFEVLSVKSRQQLSLDGGKSWVKSQELAWLRNGPRQRILRHDFGSVQPADWSFVEGASYHDRWTDGTTEWHVKGWNPDRPPTLPLRARDHVAGLVAEVLPEQPGFERDGPVGGVMMFSSHLLPLATLVKHAKRASAVTADSDAGEPCYRLTILTGNRPQAELVVDVSSSDGMVLRADEALPNHRSALRINRSHRLAGGLRFPAELTTESEKLRAKVVFDEVVMNRPATDAQLAGNFPEGIVVNDTPAGKFHVWGRDGPRLTFNDHHELKRWVASQLASESSRPPATNFWLYINLGFAAAAAVAAAFYFRRRRLLAG